MGSQRVIEWQGIGRLVAPESGAGGEFTPVRNVDGALLAKFCATSLMACQRYLAGKLSLHASAVRLPFGAVVLAGDSGAGKSTTAMSLVERDGGEFLADDIVPIDWQGSTALVAPVDDTLWLTADSSEWFGLQAPAAETPDKRGYPARARARAPERLSAIVQLVFDESAQGVLVEPLMGQEKFLALSHAHVCYSILGEDDTLRDLRSRADLATAARMFRLRRRRSMSALGGVAEALANAIQRATECAGEGDRS